MASHKLPVIDLNEISDEQELLPAVKSILLNDDTFLLRNYANIKQLDGLLYNLNHSELPDEQQGIDPNFTGVSNLGDNLFLEQYIANTDDQLQFNRQCNNASLNNLYTRLFKIGIFFANLCIRSVVLDDENQKNANISQNQYFTKITRYFYQDQTSQELPSGEIFEYPLNHDYVSHSPVGIITIFPQATNIKYKPSTISSDDNVWISIDEPDCLLLHTGSLLANLSNGIHTTSPLKICPQSNTVHLTIGPPLNTVVDSARGDTLAKCLLKQQIEDFPQIAQKFYPKEMAQLQLSKSLQFYKNLFSACETVLSLFVMSRSLGSPIELYSIFPQLSNMMRKKITQDDFLKMVSLWPECYSLKSNSRGELIIGLPERNVLATLVNKSRRLEYSERADAWFQKAVNQQTVITDVPAVKMGKRRGSDNIGTDGSMIRQKLTSMALPREKRYLANPKERFMNPEKNTDSQSNLLERLRERERKSSALLSQRQRHYQQFLTVKMKQVFGILHSLPWNRPYTVTYLTGLVVDSLQDSNNPIGISEAEEILEKLQSLLCDEISFQIVDGGLKVYRWTQLDKDSLSAKIDTMSREELTNNVDTGL
ncbi:ZYRO0F05060p [Zygosaccharomyces rouxii]|uniref:ZYRO0F05060p n=1 Tax=Zygosaccharomyces rouxii (strain ATCC 2623 / CBS 732 / NBRC 1130 / NCYC 568 / NRRL Y-229) TaxID=559307 RepID=C5DXH3_ZYGRC|nr:uncharacterized protein ZYRO0F05060g [Zygosaccharomyces rouxii]KAH9199245.1 hypothetical protein LQ764DRAFT_128075 [Zygosaccharomyces rouxii]CAR28484.1 ZYRO0F05060p [Zygosaccharomyces rouxii]